MFEKEFTPGTASAAKTPQDNNKAMVSDMESLANFRLFDRGDFLFREGDRGGEAFVIKSGCVRMTHAKGGAEEDLGVRKPGTIIGEMAVISDMPRMATAVAEEETVCIVLSRLALHRMLESIDLETRAIIEFLSCCIRDRERGVQEDEEELKRHRVLEFIIKDPETARKMEKMEPFFLLLCRSLIERAKSPDPSKKTD